MNAPRRLIIDGVSGAGKSRTLAALKSLLEPVSPGTFIDEEETLGEFMGEELPRNDLTGQEKCWRLQAVMQKIEEAGREHQPFWVIERFHPTYYALLPDWQLYDHIDASLAELGFGLVLLRLPDQELGGRSLYRHDRDPNQWASGMIDLYGSEAGVIEAFRASQQRRIECLGRTRLPYLEIETSSMDWQTFAARICAFAGVQVFDSAIFGRSNLPPGK